MEQLRTVLESANITAANAVNILVPIGILILGWIVALVVAGGTRRLLGKTQLDEKIAALVLGKERAATVDTGKWVSRITYYVVMLLVLVAVLQRLGLTMVTGPINAFLTAIFAFAPRVIAGLAIMLAAWIVATLARKLLAGTLQRVNFDDRLNVAAPTPAPGGAPAEAVPSVSQAIAETAYWLVILLFLPAALSTLGLTGILAPVQGMMEKVLAFVPNIVSASFIFMVGWFVARVVQRMVASLSAAAGLDRASERFGIARALGKAKLSGVLSMVVHVLIIIPVAVAALNALQLEAVTRPASAMLGKILAALPAIFGASLVLGLSFIIGKFVSGLVGNTLGSAGFDNALVKLGIAKNAPTAGQKTPSSVVADLVMAAIMLFALVEAVNLLGFTTLGGLMAGLVPVAGRIFLGLAIFALGLMLAGVAAKAIVGSGVTHGVLLSRLARVAVLVLAGAVGLRQMGLADEIITMGFGLCLGAVAVAAAIAFGIGARDEAGKIVRGWMEELRRSPG